MDAVEKAYELGAPFLAANVTILLIDSGFYHAMVRSNLSYYMTSASDDLSQTTSITIDTTTRN